jgi:hypothetical protein
MDERALICTPSMCVTSQISEPAHVAWLRPRMGLGSILGWLQSLLAARARAMTKIQVMTDALAVREGAQTAPGLARPGSETCGGADHACHASAIAYDDTHRRSMHRSYGRAVGFEIGAPLLPQTCQWVTGVPVPLLRYVCCQRPAGVQSCAFTGST